MAPAYLPILCLLAVQAMCEELIMLEIEPLYYPSKQLHKRQTTYGQHGQAPGRFVVRQSAEPQQLPPEYIALLQQLQAQAQAEGSTHQASLPQVQQVLVARTPDESYAEYSQQPEPTPAPAPRRPLSPEVELQGRLQQDYANKNLREQLRTPHRFVPSPQYQLSAEEQRQFDQQIAKDPQFAAYNQLYRTSDTAPQQFYRPQASPGKISYSQIESPQRPAVRVVTSHAASIQPQYYQQAEQAYRQPSPQPYAEVANPQRYAAPEAPIPQRYAAPEAAIPQQYAAPEAAIPQRYAAREVQITQRYAAPTQQYASPAKASAEDYEVPDATPAGQLPQQYLIETTKPQVPAREPTTQQLYFNAQQQAIYEEQLLAQYAQQQEAQYAQQQEPQYAQQQEPQYALQQKTQYPVRSSPSTTPRSAIYVTKSEVRPEVKGYQSYNSVPQVRIPTPDGHRPLTQTELKALVDAGFHVTSQDSEQDGPYRSSGGKRESDTEEEGSPKKQFKRLPSPVPLTEQERISLGRQGIRNLYKVESAESQDAPVTYVLALDHNALRKESDRDQ